MKPSFDKVFWIVHQEMFKPKLNMEWIKKDVADNIDYIYYQKVIPVFVKCVSDMYDRSTQFDITPVDIRDGVTKNWEWSRSVSDVDIGKTVFETEQECIDYFNKNYTEEQRKTYKEKDDFRRLQK